MPAEPGSHYTAAPIAVVVVLCLLALLLRWVFGAGRPGRRRAAGRSAPGRSPGRSAAGRPAVSRPGRVPAGVPADYGLLRTVALLPGRSEGNALRTTLADAGIRSTLSARPDGQIEVLVFAADVDRARTLLPPATPSDS